MASMSTASPYAVLIDRLVVREASVAVLGVTTRYWDYGPLDAATTMIVVHGYRGDHHGLEPVIAQIGGIRIISPDLPGFGASDAFRGRAHDLEGYAMWLRHFAAALGMEQSAVILGHSFGSIVAAAAVAGGLSTPKLILINPIARPALSGPNALMSKLTLFYYRSARALPARIGRSLLSSWLVVRFMSVYLAQSRDASLRSWVHSQHHSYFSGYASRDSVIEGFQASITSDVSTFAPRITVPTLVIGADRDPITSADDQIRLAQLFADARLVMLHEVGHLVHYERPREAAEAIVAFLGAGHLVSSPSQESA